MNNGNLVSDSLVTVTILSGMFQHRVRVLDDNNLDDVDPENLS